MKLKDFLRTSGWVVVGAIAFGTWVRAAEIRIGADRCAVRECLCEVIPEPVPEKHSRKSPQNHVTADRVVVYFDENQSSLDTRDLQDISRFLMQNRDASWFQITGYADVCGDADYNMELGEKRARSVEAVVRTAVPGTRLAVSSRGEQNASAHHEYFRKVEIVTARGVSSASARGPGWMSARLDECTFAGADYFLIDGSGSMQPYWQDIISYKFPKGSQVRLSIMTGCSNGASLPSVTPQSGTEIWYSYSKIVDEMKPGQTLCIASDFKSTVPLTGAEWNMINARVREKGIKVRDIRY